MCDCFRVQDETQTPSKKVFIGGLSNETNEKVIEEAFSKFGKVTDGKIRFVSEGCISQYITLLYWRDASPNTLNFCIGRMHPLMH